MVRSNKHWPSLFKRSTYQSSQHGINSPITGGDNDERTSQPPKPRWIATPEQVQILENIFNSGIMNPPRDEIKKIREKLQEYGPIGDFSNMTQQYDQGNILDQQVAMSMMHQQQQQQEFPQLMSSGVTSMNMMQQQQLQQQQQQQVSHVMSSGVAEPDYFRAKCTVSINNEIVEVDAGPFNIRQIFGDGAVLFDSSGQIVLTDEWGVTLNSLQHGASYFLVNKSLTCCLKL
ncbi:hypothetical protein TSUD_86850 [Trifolium subterraneum]|uniref:Homeobox domain-containing protein n=1 Tax=Trifolium subterraneum TaxID=3900 RepID=A0A2Z6PIJ4_TRISU|nr:hypothetical protein TSUD_86850 [Trifolium subterraneum]